MLGRMLLVLTFGTVSVFPHGINITVFHEAVRADTKFSDPLG
jgi:hypothetical protein